MNFKGFTPGVVPLCFGSLLGGPRGLYMGYIKAMLGKPFGGTTLGVAWNRWNP